MRIICADRSRIGLLKLKRLAGQAAFDAEIVCCRKPADVLLAASKDHIDILLTEVDFGGSRWEGIELARKLKDLQPSVNIVFVTAEAESELSSDLISLRISGFISKPYGIEEIKREFENLRYPVKA